MPFRFEDEHFGRSATTVFARLAAGGGAQGREFTHGGRSTLSRGASGAVLAPVGEPGGETAHDSDQRLVASVRAGDDRAFEALYQRYQRRIHAYVLGMVKDHGRAEDVTQEVFVSALRL